MKLNILFLLINSLIFTYPVFAQKDEKVKLPNVETIIKKYVEAVGGKKAIEKQSSRLIKGTLEMAPMGLKGTVEISTAAPNKSYTKSNIAGIGELIEGFDGKTGWSNNPIQGSREKKGDELLQTQLLNDFFRDLHFEKLYPQMEVKGVEKLGETVVYVVIATPAGLAPEIFYFDKQTGLLLRQDSTYVSPEGTFNLQTTYEDYREVDGIKIAFKVKAKNPQFEIITTITEVKHGFKFDETIFSQPK